ncbi:hypothetical protein [Chloroflexus sp.]|uniref:hypothetical protein n=1 Tax=Chloroflexus sp. TaxID=1904827 RepID=UPI002ACD337C|nr:hypothetical protein [Chloroflexus sp.]
MTLLFATSRSTAIISPPLVGSLLAYYTLRPMSALTVDTSRHIAWLRAIGVELQEYDEILTYLLQFLVNVLHMALQAVRKHFADRPMTLSFDWREYLAFARGLVSDCDVSYSAKAARRAAHSCT